MPTRSVTVHCVDEYIPPRSWVAPGEIVDFTYITDPPGVTFGAYVQEFLRTKSWGIRGVDFGPIIPDP